MSGEPTTRVDPDELWYRVTRELGDDPELAVLGEDEVWEEVRTAPDSPTPDDGLARLADRHARWKAGALARAAGALARERVEPTPDVARSFPRVARTALVAVVATLLFALLGWKAIDMSTWLDGRVEPTFKRDVAILHVIVITLFLFLRYTKFGRPRRDAQPKTRVALGAWRQFQGGWTFLWATWLALYGWLSIHFSVGFEPPWGLAVADLLNSLSAFAFLYLFLVLDKPSVPIVEEPRRDEDFRTAVLFGGSLCAAAALLSFLGRLGLFGLEEHGPRVGAIVAAVTMMYFFGRLDDRDMGIKRIMLAPLYVYVALQLSWSEVSSSGTEAGTVALLCALVLKVYIFVMITAWLRGRTLIDYLDDVAYPQRPPRT